MSRLEQALAALDALHAVDPRKVEVDGAPVPAELDYARRMSAALEEVFDSPSDVLRLAVRAQHLQRWRLPRTDYPMTKVGYHAWRRAQKEAHAILAIDTLRPLGFDESTLTRLGALIRKKNRATDPETQALEDAACLVFLDRELKAFAEGRDEDHLVDILRKTWAKMSERGRTAALTRSFDAPTTALIERALST